MIERDWSFPVTLGYIYISFSKYIDGNSNDAITTAIKNAVWEWIENTQQSHRLDEFLTISSQYVEEDASSDNGVKTVMANFFWLGENLNGQLSDDLKFEIMSDLGNIAMADGDLNETEIKWLKGFSKALGVKTAN